MKIELYNTASDILGLRVSIHCTKCDSFDDFKKWMSEGENSNHNFSYQGGRGAVNRFACIRFYRFNCNSIFHKILRSFNKKIIDFGVFFNKNKDKVHFIELLHSCNFNFTGVDRFEFYFYFPDDKNLLPFDDIDSILKLRMDFVDFMIECGLDIDKVIYE